MMPAIGMIGRSVLASIRVFGSSTMGLCRRPSVARARAPLRAGVRGAAEGPIGMHRRAGTFQAGRECNKAFFGGSNSPTGADMQPVRGPGRWPAGPRRVADPRPYTAGLVSQRPALGCLFEIVETLVLTLIIFVVIQNFVAQPYKVQQQSMEHTLEPDQYVLVDKLTPRFDTYKRGDIVVFTPPATWDAEDGTPFIKRVIGEAGDTVEIKDDGLRLHQRHGSSTSRTSISDEPGGPTQPTTAPLGRVDLDRSPRASCSSWATTAQNSADSRDVRAGRGRPDHRARVAALLADRHVRHPPDPHLPGTGPRRP